MRVVVTRPQQVPEVVEIENDLSAMQDVVGGYIECVHMGDLDIWVNEEGRLIGLPFNRFVGGVPLVGTIIVSGSTKDGATVGLSDKQVTAALGLLHVIDA